MAAKVNGNISYGACFAVVLAKSKGIVKIIA
jgi:hypothetical protein